MGIKRIVDTSFWTDEKVMDLFSPEDKLFMVYIMTNPHTTQLGIYRINLKYMALELGYSQDTIRVLIDRFENKYHIIKYSFKTKELAIKNYLKYSIIKGGKPVEDCLVKEISLVKDKSLLNYVYENIHEEDNLNETVKKVLHLLNEYDNEIKNDNDNDNEVSVYDSLTDTVTEIDFEKEFEQLWKLYPNKKGKAAAYKAYKKARSRKKDSVEYEVVLNAINAYKEYIKAAMIPRLYIKHGSTWFNQECWNDDYTVDKSAAPKDVRNEDMHLPQWYVDQRDGVKEEFEEADPDEVAAFKAMLDEKYGS